jgi:hypothetical protein
LITGEVRILYGDPSWDKKGLFYRAEQGPASFLRSPVYPDLQQVDRSTQGIDFTMGVFLDVIAVSETFTKSTD